MKRIKMAKSILISTIAIIVAAYACQDSNEMNDPISNVNDAEVIMFKKIADNSPSITSFYPNSNEEEAMSISSSLGKNFYPIKVGQSLTKTDESLSLLKDSTTAIGTLVQTYEGNLIIAGTFNQPTFGIRTQIDTTIEKPFITTITRSIQYEKISDTGNDSLDWKIVGISLPVGGTGGNEVSIQKLTLTAL